MKKSAAKTLGVAALGAAFAAVAAGSASAAPAADLLGTATGALQGVTSQQHMGAEDGKSQASDPGQAVGQVTDLLGGLPLSNLGG